MLSDKKSVQILVQQCIAKGLKEIVISPGSRNAPLILSFNSIPEIKTFTIVDERSAAFFALGMAQQLKRPVALLCTSGSAALNYAPAIVEAFYQEIPLLVLTADRPEEWIGQADGQTINQKGLYHNYIKYEANLPVELLHDDDLWYTKRIISEAFLKAISDAPGPVHINIPLREPLYGRREKNESCLSSIDLLEPDKVISDTQIEQLSQKWSQSKAIMVICGVLEPDERLNKVLNVLSSQFNTVILTETTSNIKGQKIIESIDRQIFNLKEDCKNKFSPDLLISFGGQIVSKQIKKYLREYVPKEHWHISMNTNIIDTFQSLTMHIKMNPVAFFKQIVNKVDSKKSTYQDLWVNHTLVTRKFHEEYLKNVEWSDIKAMNYLFTHLPDKCSLQLANSTPVRYAQLFQDEIKVNTFSNRGTSGIDGALSTAAGAAFVCKEPTILVIGDLSFFYDSNGLWNRYLKSNFKIVLINNGGGGIFRFIPGPAETEELEEFFEAKHQQTAKYIAKAFNLRYISCSNENELENGFSELLDNNEQPGILEVFTPSELNGRLLRGYFKTLKSKID